MTDRSSDEDLVALVGDLVRALRDLERELESPPTRRRPPLPTPRELRRFASEVAIPGLILVLETNVRALRLLQRALELGDGAERTGDAIGDLRERAMAASETTLDRLDDALGELGRAIEGRPGNDDAAELLEEARRLRDEVRSRLADETGRGSLDRPADAARGTTAGADAGQPVEIDVEAELESIKDELDREGRDRADEAPDDQTDETSADRDDEADSDDVTGGDDGDDRQ